MNAFVVFAAVVAAASANPQVLLSNGIWGGHALAYNAAPLATHHQVVAAPAVSYAVPAVTKTQYHAQDELGQASYGYAHPGQAHAAVRDAAGNVRGSYAYVNPEGKEVRVEYVADQGGFRVASNALPVAPVAAPVPQVASLVGPAPVQETPEVIQARAAHAVAHQEALARSGRKKRGVITSAVLPAHTLGYSSVIGHPVSAYGYGYSNVISHPVNTVALGSVASHVVASPVTYSAASPVTYSAAVASPVTYSAVAAPVSVAVAAQPVREATLTKVVNTPGHAVSYRVD